VLGFQGSNIEGVRIPLCSYVEVLEAKAENPIESGASLALDAGLGCISCREEAQQQCTKVPQSDCR